MIIYRIDVMLKMFSLIHCEQTFSKKIVGTQKVALTCMWMVATCTWNAAVQRHDAVVMPTCAPISNPIRHMSIDASITKVYHCLIIADISNFLKHALLSTTPLYLEDNYSG